MEHPLIVGVDGSDAGLEAVDWAVDEAVRRGAALRIVHASSGERYEGREPSFTVDRSSVRVHADHVTAQAVERARRRAAAAEATGEVLPDDPAAALIAASRAACAVVVGSRGRGEPAGLLLGSVSLSVAAHAESPVIVVRGGERNRTGGFGQVAVGVGETGTAVGALSYAFTAAEQRGAALRAVHVWRCPADEVPDHPRATGFTDGHQRRARARLDEALHDPIRAHRTVTVRREITEGRARTALLEAAAAADLLVVGARRRTGHVGMQLGPVNRALLHHAACPVAVVAHA